MHFTLETAMRSPIDKNISEKDLADSAPALLLAMKPSASTSSTSSNSSNSSTGHHRRSLSNPESTTKASTTETMEYPASSKLSELASTLSVAAAKVAAPETVTDSVRSKRLPSISLLLNPAPSIPSCSMISSSATCTTMVSSAMDRDNITSAPAPSPPDSNEQSPQFAPRPLPPPFLPPSRLMSAARFGSSTISLPLIAMTNSSISGHAHKRSLSQDSVASSTVSSAASSSTYRHSISFESPQASSKYHPYISSSHNRQYPSPNLQHIDAHSGSVSSPSSSYNRYPLPTAGHNPVSHFQKTAPHKSLRYDMLKDGTPIQRSCGDCDSTHTSGHWCQDPLVVGGYICQKCYRRRKRAAKSYTPPTRTCTSCSTNTSPLWFKHFSLPQAYVCVECHEKEAVVDSKLSSMKKCHGCGSCKSTQWTSDANGDVCRKCARQLGLVGHGTHDSNMDVESSPAISMQTVQEME